MYTLSNALRVLRQLDIEPGEIEIPKDIYVYITRRAQEIDEEEVDEAEDEEEPY